MGRAQTTWVAGCAAAIGVLLGLAPLGDAGAARAPGCARAAAAVEADAAPAKVRSAMRCLVTSERARFGRRALRPSRALRDAAHAHAADMVRHHFFSHRSRDGRQVGDRVRAAGYGARSFRILGTGEAMAWASGRHVTMRRLFRALMRSPTHRRLLLSSRWRHIGVWLQPGAPQAGVAGGATLVITVGRRTRTA